MRDSFLFFFSCKVLVFLCRDFLHVGERKSSEYANGSNFEQVSHLSQVFDSFTRWLGSYLRRCVQRWKGYSSNSLDPSIGRSHTIYET